MYIIRQKETGAVIDHSCDEDIAHRICKLHEDLDKIGGIYEPGFYEVWNEEKWIYDVNRKKYYELEMFIPPYIDNNEEAIYIFQDIQDFKHRLMLKENDIIRFFGGKEFLEYWRKSCLSKNY